MSLNGVRSLVPVVCCASHAGAVSQKKQESTYRRVPLGETSQASGALGVNTIKLVAPTVIPLL